MEYKWEYKGVVIGITPDGKFTFSFLNTKHSWESLNKCKEHIDDLTKEFYTFTLAEIDRFYNKLTSKEKCLIKQMIKELHIHSDNAYCELSITDNFNFDLSEFYNYFSVNEYAKN